MVTQNGTNPQKLFYDQTDKSIIDVCVFRLESKILVARQFLHILIKVDVYIHKYTQIQKTCYLRQK